MNKNRFRRVFSKRLGMLVAVAEDVVSQGKAPGEGTASQAASNEGAFGVVSAMTAFAAAILATQPGVSFAQALPTGGQVTAGQASISQNANTMTINQGTQRAVIDWNSFNVGAGNTVQFNQPNAQSQALNRVTSGGASNIQGSLLANGQVLIQTANGVLFGKGAIVNVGSLLATTKSIDANQFMAGGPLQLSSTGTNASVENDGAIQAQGYVTLVGDQVRDTGSINTAQGGQLDERYGHLDRAERDDQHDRQRHDQHLGYGVGGARRCMQDRPRSPRAYRRGHVPPSRLPRMDGRENQRRVPGRGAASDRKRR